MRQLVLTRGSMGSGKSVFLKQNGLYPYTLCPDEIRLLFQSPVMADSGKLTTSMKNEKKVWELLFNLLEERMKRGEFTCIDATHSKQSDFAKYRELAQKYRYRCTVVDFTHIPIEVAKEQNLMRPDYKQVPEKSIDNLYERFKTQLPTGWVNVVKPEELNTVIQYTPTDFSQWKKIHTIGDLQGCFTVLQEYLKDGIHDDELYIFVGDACDRGIENAQVLNFMLEIMEQKNVIFIEGNHEIHLWRWANDEGESFSEQFEKYTKPELEEAKIDKKQVRMFYRKLRQLVYFTYGDKHVIVTHGGISNMPDNLMYIATEQFIKGVGDYTLDVDNAFYENTMDRPNLYQIHGHRNIQQNPIQVNERTFNLEGGVERGGHLRVVTLDADGFQAVEVKNDVFHDKYIPKIPIPVNIDHNSFIEKLRGHKYIKEKKLRDNISSFNFTREAFSGKKWDEVNIRARGLFVNMETTEICSKSYNKFFNVNERSFTKIGELSKTLQFPVTIYDKPNGFLGILGYNAQFDEMIFCSKSSMDGVKDGQYAEMFRRIFTSKVPVEKQDEIKLFLKDQNVSMIFEVIDPVNDPHIIKYDSEDVILLDIIFREPDFKKMDYQKVVDKANEIGVRYKELISVTDNWNEFYKWYERVTDESFQDMIEGFVIEDAVGFMTKIKCPYYNFWKHMRGFKDKVARNNKINLGELYSPAHNQFYNWLKDQDKDYISKSSIIELRDRFVSKGGLKK